MEQALGYLREAVERTQRFAGTGTSPTDETVSSSSSDLSSKMEVDGEQPSQEQEEPSQEPKPRIEFHKSEIFPYKVRKPTARELEALHNLEMSSKAQDAALAAIEGGNDESSSSASSSTISASCTSFSTSAREQPLVMSVGPEALAAFAATSAGRKKRKRSNREEIFAEVRRERGRSACLFPSLPCPSRRLTFYLIMSP